MVSDPNQEFHFKNSEILDSNTGKKVSLKLPNPGEQNSLSANKKINIDGSKGDCTKMIKPLFSDGNYKLTALTQSITTVRLTTQYYQ